MRRVEGNKAKLEHTQDLYDNSQAESFKEKLLIMTGCQTEILADISVSLAVIADALRERNKNHE